MSVRLKAGEELLPWIDAGAAAKHMGMTPRVVARLAKRGKIRAGFDGRRWKFKATFCDEYLLMKGGSR